ncbi:DUF4062 domain-containing protein [Azospirillum brasilense]|uniref:DUF4062 domain-containing protein n=1 Tax=Azospirillum brasilense TaxID=192 RepID=UPI0013B414D8|nr:DUF4062 domain-containing protein [Azospirillum brasilense]
MPTKVRVFISSTMEDLANERQAVVEQVRGLGLEPVNAEGLLPNGETSWNLLADEIRTSHVFILILGDRYGWIPTTGYGAGQNKGVTHLEVDLARSLNIPILPFFKKLKYGSDASSDDAVRRDHFRTEIGDWSKGIFRAEFDWAIDLGQKVRTALLDVFQDTYLKQLVRKLEAGRSTITEPTSQPPLGFGSGPQRSPSSILFAGAGFSIAAGYPTASALAEILGQRLGLQSSGVEILSRHSFTDVAALAEAKLGRASIIRAIQELLDTPLPVTPTRAHLAAVQAFPIIITTNYDLLFERACKMLSINYAVYTPTSFRPNGQADVTIYKIDGSISDPDTLILTDADAYRAQITSAFWNPIASALQNCRLVIVGHSVRDPTSRRILNSRNRELPGVYVSPYLDELDAVLLHRYSLEGIKTDADTYMTAALSLSAHPLNLSS